MIQVTGKEMAVLRTMRLTLSPCRPSDRTDFMALELDPEVMRFLNGGRAVDHTQDELNAPFLMPRGTESYVWTARYIADGAFVGWFCLWPENETSAELGYRLRRADWGRDWPRRALRLSSTGGSEAADMTGSWRPRWR